MLSLADCTPLGKGVLVGAGVNVASAGGVLVGCSMLEPESVGGDAGAEVGSAPPPQAIIRAATRPAMPNMPGLQSLVMGRFMTIFRPP